MSDIADLRWKKWQDKLLMEQEKIHRELDPIKKQIEIWENDSKKIQDTIDHLENPNRFEDTLSYFSRTNINVEVRNKFQQVRDEILDVIVFLLRETISEPVNNFHEVLLEKMEQWKKQGSKGDDLILSWVEEQVARIKDVQKRLEKIIHGVDTGQQWFRLPVSNILDDPSMKEILKIEEDHLDALQVAIDYAQMSQSELKKIVQGQKIKLAKLQKKIQRGYANVSKLDAELEPIESALYITEEMYKSNYASGEQGAIPMRFTGKKWCYVNTRVYDAPNGAELPRIPNRVPIPPGGIVNLTGKIKNIDDTFWVEILYPYHEYSKENKAWEERTVTGWVNDLYLDDYNEKFPDNEVTILNPTADPNDAQQYMVWEDAEKYNMCGELCVAYIVQKDIDSTSSLESVLERWRDSPTKGSFSYTSKTVRLGTYAPHLKDILQTYPEFNNDQDEDQIVDFRTGLKDGAFTWDGIKDRIRTHYLIALVTIGKSKGELIKKNNAGVSHWVLLEKITRNGNRVELYNPFPNKRQEYSFAEFASSCSSSLSGIWVKRKTPLSADLEEKTLGNIHQVQLGTDRHDPGQAEQYIYREGAKKTNLCGEFSVTYILDKSIDKALDHWKENPPSDLGEMAIILNAYGCYKKKEVGGLSENSFTIGSVLDYWKKTQQKLYEYHVRDNKPTGTRELRNLLRSYGYTNPEDFIDLKTGLTDQSTGEYLPSPGRMAKMLKTHFLIAGVGIEGRFGKLKSGSNAIRHWVVIEQITPSGRQYINKYFGGNRGWVELYNPFMNVIEEYSYNELSTSMNETGSDWYGLWVKREVQPVFVPQEIMFPNIDEPETKGRKGGREKKDVKIMWPEKRLHDQIEKMLKKKKRVEDIPRLLSMKSGWSEESIANLLPKTKNEDDTSTDTLIPLVRDQLNVESLPTEVEAWLTKKASGNPSLAVDLAYALRESGILEIDDENIGRIIDTAHGRNQHNIGGGIMDVSSQSTPTVKSVIGSIFASQVLKEIKK